MLDFIGIYILVIIIDGWQPIPMRGLPSEPIAIREPTIPLKYEIAIRMAIREITQNER